MYGCSTLAMKLQRNGALYDVTLTRGQGTMTPNAKVTSSSSEIVESPYADGQDFLASFQAERERKSSAEAFRKIQQEMDEQLNKHFQELHAMHEQIDKLRKEKAKAQEQFDSLRDSVGNARLKELVKDPSRKQSMIENFTSGGGGAASAVTNADYAWQATAAKPSERAGVGEVRERVQEVCVVGVFT